MNSATLNEDGRMAVYKPFNIYFDLLAKKEESDKLTLTVSMPSKPILGRGGQLGSVPVTGSMKYGGGSDRAAHVASSGDGFPCENSYFTSRPWSSGFDESMVPGPNGNSCIKSTMYWNNLSQNGPVFGGTERFPYTISTYDRSECYSNGDTIETPVCPQTSPASSVGTSLPSPSRGIFQNYSRNHSLLSDNTYKPPSPQGRAPFWSEATRILPKAEKSGISNGAYFLSRGSISGATGQYSSTKSAADKQLESESSNTVQRHGYPAIQWNNGNSLVTRRSSEQFDTGMLLKCSTNGSPRQAGSLDDGCFPSQFQIGTWTQAGNNSPKAVDDYIPNDVNHSLRPSATGESECYPRTRSPAAADVLDSQLEQDLFQTKQEQNGCLPSLWNSEFTQLTSDSSEQFENGIMLNRSANPSPPQTGSVGPCRLPLSDIQDTDLTQMLLQNVEHRPSHYNSRWSLDEGKFCAFCKKNRETREYYTTHVIKDSHGKIICPILRNYVCPICHATGDNAHTIGHCPYRLKP